MSINYEKFWSSGNSANLLKLAKDIESQDAWRSFLTIQEHKVFKYALEKGGDVWNEFINGNIICRLEQPNLSSSNDSKVNNKQMNGSAKLDTHALDDTRANTPTNASATPQNKPNTELTKNEKKGVRLVNLDPVTVAFRVRYMLYEKSIQFIFPSLDPDISPEVDYQIFEDTQPANSLENSSLVKVPAKREIDDDYDDDESDSDDKKVTSVPSKPDNTSEIPRDANGKFIITIPNTIPNEQDIRKRKEAFRISIDRIYHIFEDDEDNLQKQKKLEELDQQIESDIQESATPETTNNTKSQFGAANLSLKYLLSAIQSKQKKLNMTERELGLLLSDVRKNRSKWASEDRVGQEELYEAAEKVVLQLRANTEHSTPFLNKVNKRDAPNYFNIIKHPMDLNTVMKKLRSLQYRCKKDFVDDLMLIWENCFQYNTDPKHHIRKHANAMKVKTLSLIPLIPDITIRDRAEVEAEEAKLQQLEDESDEEVKSGKHVTKGKKRKLHHNSGTNEDISNDKEQKSDSKDTPAESNTVDSYNAYDQDVNYDPELNFGNLESHLYQEIYGEQALKYVSKRSELFKDNKLQIECPALIRDSKAMGRFDENEHDAFKSTEAKEELSSSKGQGLYRGFLESGNNLGLENNDLLVEYDTSCGLPEFPWNISSQNNSDGSEMFNIKDIKPSGFVCKEGQSKLIDKSLEQIQIIRKICSKIELIRQMQQQVFLHTTQYKPYEIQPINEQDLDPASRLPNRDPFNKEVAFAALKKSMAKIAMSTGFEETETMAIDSLTQIAGEFLGKLGQSVALWMEGSQPGEMSMENILLTVLEENGIEMAPDLTSYIQEDIEKQTQRLLDQKKKLTVFLADLLRPTGELTDNEFKDGSEQFVTGDFSEEVGDDFFGFKELGIEEELGLSSLSVPLHILQTRNFNFNIDNSQTILKSHLLQVPEYDLIDKTLAEKQITPVKNALLKRFDIPACTTDADGKTVLLEGDQLPPKFRITRLKVPPTGKLPSYRRKAVSKVFFLPEANTSE